MSAVTTQPLPVPLKPSVAPSGDDVLAAPRVRRWTRDEYYQMASLGWFRGKRVLLLDGEIIEMAGQGNWHSIALEMCERVLRDLFPKDRYWVRGQRPLDLPDGSSDPEPDLAVVPGNPADFHQHPSTALLVVEVSDSSLRLDRRKANAYAAAGVEDYWIINLPDRVVEVYRDPVPDATAEFGHRYGSLVTLRPGDLVIPLAAGKGPLIAVADLLPARPAGETF